MDKKHYSVARVKNSGEVVYFEYDKVEGYRFNPTTKKEDTIGVSKAFAVHKRRRRNAHTDIFATFPVVKVVLAFKSVHCKV